MAHERIEKMKKETGRITNVDLQRKVTESYSTFMRNSPDFLLTTNYTDKKRSSFATNLAR